LPIIEYSHSVKPVKLPPRLGEARDHPALDRVADPRKYDRNATSLLLQRRHRPPACNQDHVRLAGDQLRCVHPYPAHIVRRPAVVDPQVAPFDPT